MPYERQAIIRCYNICVDSSFESSQRSEIFVFDFIQFGFSRYMVINYST